MASMRQPPRFWSRENWYLVDPGDTTKMPAWSCPAVCNVAKCGPVRLTKAVDGPPVCGLTPLRVLALTTFGASMIVAAEPGRHVRLNLGVRYSCAMACLCPSKLALAARKPLTMSAGLQPGPGATGTISTPCWASLPEPCSVFSGTLPLLGNVAQAVAAAPRITVPSAATQRRFVMRVPAPVPAPGSRCRRLGQAARRGDAHSATRGRPRRA